MKEEISEIIAQMIFEEAGFAASRKLAWDICDKLESEGYELTKIEPTPPEQKEAGSEGFIESLNEKLLDAENYNEINAATEAIDKMEQKILQAQQPGSGEVMIAKLEEVIENNSELWHSGVINRIAAAIYKDIVESLQKENDLKERLLIAALARIELQEQKISDKDKEIEKLKIPL